MEDWAPATSTSESKNIQKEAKRELVTNLQVERKLRYQTYKASNLGNFSSKFIPDQTHSTVVYDGKLSLGRDGEIVAWSRGGGVRKVNSIMIQWAKDLRTAFGLRLLWLVCLVYFTQGFRSFVWTAVSYQLKDKLKLSPSASQSVTSISFFPWSIKPVYGIMSDFIPIRGRKRSPYLLISSLLSFLPWVYLSSDISSRNSITSFLILLTVQNLGSAMADVVIDAMIAEAVKSERATFGGDLQSVSWMAMAFGGICGSLTGGYALANIPIETIFLLFSVFPAMQLLSCFMIDESSVGSDASFNDIALHESLESEQNGDFLDDNISAHQAKQMTLRRKKSKNSPKQDAITANKVQFLEAHGSSRRWFYSLKTAASSLFQAFKQPMIYRPMAWFFLANVSIPNLSTVMFYYQTESLKLEPSFLGTARVIGWLGLILGTLIYNRYLKKLDLRRILLFAQIGLAFSIILDGVLVSQLNLLLGISDEVMVLFGSALSDAINQFKFMPFLILSGQLCPPGIEGTLFALFMSINNFGSTVGSFVGAAVASLLNISSGNFDNLLLGILIQVLCTFIPVAFLFLIPREATGVST